MRLGSWQKRQEKGKKYIHTFLLKKIVSVKLRLLRRKL